MVFFFLKQLGLLNMVKKDLHKELKVVLCECLVLMMHRQVFEINILQIPRL